jgi:hypothetical protein
MVITMTNLNGLAEVEGRVVWGGQGGSPN